MTLQPITGIIARRFLQDKAKVRFDNCFDSSTCTVLGVKIESSQQLATQPVLRQSWGYRE